MSAKKPRLKLKCEGCGKAYFRLACQLRPGARRFCSFDCRKVKRVSLKCKKCGKKFERMKCELTRGRGEFCSKRCMYAARKTGRRYKCSWCGKMFYRKNSEAVSRRPFCSKRCLDLARNEHATSYPKIGSRHAHRIVAEIKLGRKLKPGEVVHHIDENKRNFAPGNLEVLSGQSEHVRHHFKGKKRKAKA